MTTKKRTRAADKLRPIVRSCEECTRFAYNAGAPDTVPRRTFRDWYICAKGHRPRFMAPKYEYQHAPWGWRRTCADFKARDLRKPIPFKVRSNTAPQRMARPSAGATYAGGDGSEGNDNG